jgi:hypothetical protein
MTGVGFEPANTTTPATIIDTDGVFPNSSSCYYRAVSLPNGATVTLLSAVLSDTTTSVGVDLELLATPFDPHGNVSMVKLNTTAAATPGTFSGGNTTILQATINNASNAYSLAFCGGPNANLINAEIDYTLP